jgi:magnesium chelatase family protein
VQRIRYARRLSAPLLDRFDLRLTISTDDAKPVETEAGEQVPPDSSAVVAARVAAAVERQRIRLRGTNWRRNAHIPAGALERYTALSPDAQRVWLQICVLRGLTGRGAARIRRVARTIADLDDCSEIDVDHVDRAAWMREDLW